MNDVVEDYYAEIDAAAKLLPAWFIPRMMGDVWSFGLLLNTGHTLCISQIDNIHQAADGSLWIDVTMADNKGMIGFLNDPDRPLRHKDLILAPTSRTTASVNVAHIVAAFELADT